MLKTKQSSGVVCAIIGLFGLCEFWLKSYLVSTAPDTISINPGAAFGLGNSSTSWWGIGLLIILALLQRLRPLYVWLTLIFVVILGVFERWRFGGAVDYLQINGLWFNLTDLVIIGLVIALLIFWQQKNGPER